MTNLTIQENPPEETEFDKLYQKEIANIDADLAYLCKKSWFYECIDWKKADTLLQKEIEETIKQREEQTANEKFEPEEAFK